MRTIKFRGKCCHSDAWVFGDLEVNRLDERTLIHTYYDDKRYHCQCDVRADTVGQFTGLYDKNGEEIYEGDVVKFANPKYGDELFRIGYEDSHIGAFCLCEAGEEDTSRFVAIFGRFDYEPFYCEVIGNIHDNPELLEGGEK